MLLTGEPEASMEVPQHILVLARLPNVLDSIGQLFPLDPGQFLLLHWRERHVGDRVPWIWGGGLWVEKDGKQKGVRGMEKGNDKKVEGRRQKGSGGERR